MSSASSSSFSCGELFSFSSYILMCSFSSSLSSSWTSIWCATLLYTSSSSYYLASSLSSSKSFEFIFFCIFAKSSIYFCTTMLDFFLILLAHSQIFFVVKFNHFYHFLLPLNCVLVSCWSTSCICDSKF